MGFDMWGVRRWCHGEKEEPEQRHRGGMAWDPQDCGVSRGPGGRKSRCPLQGRRRSRELLWSP